MLRIASGVVDQKISFMATPGLGSLGTFSVYRSRNGAASVLYTTPTITEDGTVPGMFHFTMDEDMTLDPGHVTEHMLYVIKNTAQPDWTKQYEVELFVPSSIRKNQPYSNFTFLLLQSIDHVSPAVGATVTAQRSIDGGAFASCANAVASVGNGIYKIDLAASDLNGDNIVLLFSATGCDSKFVILIPARA